MIIHAEQVKPIQNMGLADRVARFIIGGGVLGALVLVYEMKHPVLSDAWEFSLVALSLYPVLTSIIGWDPFYSMTGLRTGSSRGRNQCGSFPYQVKALLGHAPRYCEIDSERSLEACHDTDNERPLHRVWAVDREPIIYPDDATFDEYIRRHMPRRRDGTAGVSPAAEKSPRPPMGRAA